jgi:hypothetical protein
MMEDLAVKYPINILLFSAQVVLAVPSPQLFAAFLLICPQITWNLVQILFTSIE